MLPGIAQRTVGMRFDEPIDPILIRGRHELIATIFGLGCRVLNWGFVLDRFGVGWVRTWGSCATPG